MSAQWPTVQLEAAVGNPGPNTWLVFNDTTQGLLDTDTFASTAFTDVTADMRSVTVRRGRQRSLDQFQVGNMSVVLDDNAGTYGLGAAGITPNVPARLRASVPGDGSYYLFTGTADSWQPGYTGGRYSDTTTTLSSSDGFKLLQAYQPAAPGISRPSETTDARVSGVLAQASWTTTAEQLDVSTTTLASSTLTGTALSDIQAAANSEQGRFYIGPDGKAVFENRNHRLTQARSNVSQATWESRAVTGGSFQFESCVAVIDDTLVQNSISAQRSGGSLKTATDATSIAANYTHAYNDTSLLLSNDTDVQSWATWQLWLHKNVELRIDSISFRPYLQADNTYFTQALNTQISDQITVTVYPPRGTTYTQVSYVEGIEHSISTAPQDWVTTFYLSSATQTTGANQMLIFDSGTLGLLDTDRLAGW